MQTLYSCTSGKIQTSVFFRHRHAMGKRVKISTQNIPIEGFLQTCNYLLTISWCSQSRFQACDCLALSISVTFLTCICSDELVNYLWSVHPTWLELVTFHSKIHCKEKAAVSGLFVDAFQIVLILTNIDSALPTCASWTLLRDKNALALMPLTSRGTYKARQIVMCKTTNTDMTWIPASDSCCERQECIANLISRIIEGL